MRRILGSMNSAHAAGRDSVIDPIPIDTYMYLHQRTEPLKLVALEAASALAANEGVTPTRAHIERALRAICDAPEIMKSILGPEIIKNPNLDAEALSQNR